jgi:glycosyltransferase involved in cell wall biosynthesis
MTPTISVVVSSFNFGRYVGATLDSVRRQTFRDFEAVIVDDGSTDDSLAVIGRYLEDDRFRLVRQRHQGQARCKNRGLVEARGQFLAFLDADDIWAANKLMFQWQRFQLDPDLGVVFSRRELIDADGLPLYEPKRLFPRGDVLDHMFLQNFICFSTALVRREVVEHVGLFDERLNLGIDYDFWLRAAQHYTFDYVDEPLAAYRIGHANLSRRQHERLRTALMIMHRFRRHYGGDGRLDLQVAAQADSETCGNLSVFSRGYSRREAIAWAMRALRAAPLRWQPWRRLIAALAPEWFRRTVRRVCGSDGAWERHCHTSFNCPEPIL